MSGRTELIARAPGDKSVSQRALILGAMAEGESRVRGLLRSADPLATGRAVRALGVEVTGLDGGPTDPVLIRGRGRRAWRQPPGPLDLCNSGTGARLLAGALAAQPLSVVLDGDASLRRRPMERIATPLRRMGARVSYMGRPGLLPMRIEGGTLAATAYESPVASAQIKSAVLLAGVGAGVETQVSEPRRSRDHTERMLEAMGATVREEERDGRWCVRAAPPDGELAPLDMQIPADPSSAAFLLGLAALSEGLTVVVPGVGLSETRTGFFRVLERMGAEVTVSRRGSEGGEPVGDVRVAGQGGLRAVDVAGSEVPGMIDEIPLLAAMAARAEGVTRIAGAGELRVKESDRLAALAANLREVGVPVEELADGIEVEGVRRPLSGRVRSFGDHRVAMAFGVLGATPRCEFEIDDPAVAGVSFPGFWDLLARASERAAAGRLVSIGGSGPGAASVPARSAAARSPVTSPAEGVPAADRQVRRSDRRARLSQPRPHSVCVVVAIDGPAGAGKSTTARAVARKLGFRHLDSGALYRAATHALLEAGWTAENEIAPHDVAGLRVSAGWDGEAMHACLDGRRLADETLRAAPVTALVSQISAAPAVRARLLAVQREAAQGPGLVADGRDMGTVVFPRAQVKVFLIADVDERARRRLLQAGIAAPSPAQVAEQAERLAERDRLDASRQAAPLAQAADATPLDTTAMAFAAQVDAIADLVEAAGFAGAPVAEASRVRHQ